MKDPQRKKKLYEKWDNNQGGSLLRKEIPETPISSAASWSIAKQSGRKEDFEAYFKRDLDTYTKEQEMYQRGK